MEFNTITLNHSDTSPTVAPYSQELTLVAYEITCYLYKTKVEGIPYNAHCRE